MGQKQKLSIPRESEAKRDVRDQEVARANRELAAYFKGQRTEREARAALKTIKAFVRDRERQAESARRPLPNAGLAKTPKKVMKRDVTGARGDRFHLPQNAGEVVE